MRSLFVIAGLIAGLGAAATDCSANAESVKALIERQSQEFSDASASGDRGTLERYLDDRVTFMVESGEVATKRDVLESAQPSANPHFSNHLRQSDFTIELFGDTAVTSFTDNAEVQFYGQTIHARFRSTEVWHRSRDRWLMISSQTVAVPDDPPAVPVPSALLDEYVGRYAAAEEYVLEISQAQGELQGRIQGGAPFPILVEARDVLFTPGQPRLRRVIQRDASGKIVALLSRREGHDIVLKRVD